MMKRVSVCAGIVSLGLLVSASVSAQGEGPLPEAWPPAPPVASTPSVRAKVPRGPATSALADGACMPIDAQSDRSRSEV